MSERLYPAPRLTSHQVIKTHGMCIEEVFLAKNFPSALKLGQARGVALLSAGSASIQ